MASCDCGIGSNNLPCCYCCCIFCPKVCDTLPAETSPADGSQQSVEATEAAQNCPSAADVAATVQHQSEWGESTPWQKLHRGVLPMGSTSAWSLTLAQQHIRLQGYLHHIRPLCLLGQHGCIHTSQSSDCNVTVASWQHGSSSDRP